MLKVILAKIGISLFRYLPLEQIVAKLLTSVIKKLLESCKASKIIDRVRKTVTHLNELTALIEPMLDDQAVTGDEAREMYDHVNQTRLEILQTWSKGESAKELEAHLPKRDSESARKGSVHALPFLRVFVACLWVVGTNQSAKTNQHTGIQKTFFDEKINSSSSFQGVSSQGCVGFGWWIGWFLAVFFRTFSNGRIHFFKTPKSHKTPKNKGRNVCSGLKIGSGDWI